jgi:glycosyltransferase involved in cell wall biosynthesis
MNLRICYLSNSILPGERANGVHVVNMCSGLASLGHEVTLFGWPGRESIQAEELQDWYGVPRNFRLAWLGGKKGNLASVRSGWSLPGKPGAYDLVFGRNLFACWAAGRRGHRVVFETHTPWQHLSLPRRMLLRDLFRRPAFLGIVVISKPIAASLIEHKVLSPDRILVASDAATDPPRTDPAPLRSKAGRLAAGYLGHLYKGRGIEIIEALARRLPQLDFHVIGGTKNDVAEWTAKTSDVENLFFHGFVPPAQTAAFRAAFDILLAPYQKSVELHGGLDTSAWMSPLKLFEYMAAGKPIICSDSPVLHEVMKHDVNCLLCPPDDITAWENALNGLAGSTKLRKRLGAAARNDFEQNYTWQRRAERILAMFHRPSQIGPLAPE